MIYNEGHYRNASPKEQARMAKLDLLASKREASQAADWAEANRLQRLLDQLEAFIVA